MERPAATTIFLIPPGRERGTHMALAIDANRRLVEMAEHKALRVVAREGRVARLDGLAQSDRDRGGVRRDVAGREEAALLRGLGGGSDGTPPCARVCAGPRPPQCDGSDERFAMRWHEITIHYTISPWDSHAPSS